MRNITPVRALRAAGAVALTGGFTLLFGLGATVAQAQPNATGSTARETSHALSVSLKWDRLLGANTQVVESSPNQAVLDNQGTSIVVGSRGNGCVYAVHLSNGSTTPGWPRCTDAGIDSTASVYKLSGNLDDVFVTTGDTPGEQPPVYNENCNGNLSACVGGIYAFGPGGNTIWSRYLPNVFGTPTPHPPIFASPTIGNTGTGKPQIVVGGISQTLYALNPSNGATEPGWPQQTADTTFATAAIANVNNSQRIIAASDSTAGAFNNWNGGSVRSMNANGSTNWTTASNEVVTSSPVVGNLGSGPVVAYGHGRFWNGSDEDALTVDNAANGGLEWKVHLGGYTRATPAIADLGNGENDIVEPTWTALGKTDGGTVSAFGSRGNKLWGPVPLGPGSIGSENTITGGVATADLGNGYQDVIAATGLGWYIIDGRTGNVVSSNGLNVTWPGQHAANLAMSNSPLVVPDPSGTGVDVVVSGTYSGGSGDNTQGFIAVYHVTGGGNSAGAGAWPQFHHDPQLTGSTIAPASNVIVCSPAVPPCTIEGYWMDASDGGIFAYGKSGFAGSMGGKPLNAPIVGMARTPDGKGYWMVASDGGIFAFGDAPYFGSMGGRHLNKPIVGMASAPGGDGYWLVASDGGIFSFGPTAKFFGSMGGRPLDKPIVGMAAAPDSDGYWMVASDGGIFSFGTGAKFWGSMGGRHLNKPVVGMTASPGGGYWMVASDGGIFSFHTGYYGSTGSIRLNKPVVGMASTSSGHGYWLVASDGGIFSYGDAFFKGSTGNIVLNSPIVGMAAVG